MNTANIGKDIFPYPGEAARSTARRIIEQTTQQRATELARVLEHTPATVVALAEKHAFDEPERLEFLTHQQQHNPDTFEEIVRSGFIQPGDEEDAVPITAPMPQLREAMAKKSNGHAIIGAQVADQRDAIWLSSESNEWYTPAQYIEAARQVMGDIDIDPASNTTANETVKAAEYYTKDTNGLEHHWKGRVWLNPPYGGLSGPFVSKLMEEIRLGNVQQAVVLVNANSTETNWFAPLWCHTLCFTNHRIDFVSPGGAKNGSTHGSVFIYVGPNKYEFARAFRQFGFVVEQVVLPVIATIGQEALKIA